MRGCVLNKACSSHGKQRVQTVMKRRSAGAESRHPLLFCISAGGESEGGANQLRDGSVGGVHPRLGDRREHRHRRAFIRADEAVRGCSQLCCLHCSRARVWGLSARCMAVLYPASAHAHLTPSHAWTPQKLSNLPRRSCRISSATDNPTRSRSLTLAHSCSPQSPPKTLGGIVKAETPRPWRNHAYGC